MSGGLPGRNEPDFITTKCINHNKQLICTAHPDSNPSFFLHRIRIFHVNCQRIVENPFRIGKRNIVLLEIALCFGGIKLKFHL